jgi:hypothetical protein
MSLKCKAIFNISIIKILIIHVAINVFVIYMNSLKKIDSY